MVPRNSAYLVNKNSYTAKTRTHLDNKNRYTMYIPGIHYLFIKNYVPAEEPQNTFCSNSFK